MSASFAVSVFVAAVLIDLLFGELPTRVHPVVWMGRWIRWFERPMPRHGRAALASGAVLAALTVAAFAALAVVILRLASVDPLAVSYTHLTLPTKA